MGYKIGIDFGTTNSTISYIDEEGRLTAFKYPMVDGHEYIPTCIAYPDKNCCVGWAALDYAGDNASHFCNNLKMILPLNDDDRKKYTWTDARQPELAIKEFFTRILLKDTASFSKQIGPIDAVVCTVPHVWAHSFEHAGYSRLHAIIQETLGEGRPFQLVSEPVSAAAFFAYRKMKQGTPFMGNLLVCDMGGGTFDVTLCKLSKNKVEELLNDGNGWRDLGQAGVFFDTNLILNAMEGKDWKEGEKASYFAEYYKALQDYKSHSHDDIRGAIITAIEDALCRKLPVLRAGPPRRGLSFNFEEVETAFAEVKQGIHEVIDRIKIKAAHKGYSIDMVFLVGGFSLFYLVEETIKKALGIEEQRLVKDVNREFSRYAISFGAALLANDLISVEEKYEHTIGIAAEILVEEDGKPTLREVMDFPIIVGGKKLREYEEVHFLDGMLVNSKSPHVTIYMDKESEGRPIYKKLDPKSLGINLPDADTWRRNWKVGMYVNQSKIVYLVFEEDSKDKKRLRFQYELGDLLRKMFGGIYKLQKSERKGRTK